MNYIELINLFWQTRRTVRLSSAEADLYYFLMQECNVRNWENPFGCPNGLICATIGFSEKTLIDVRNRLQQKGLIEFKPGQRKTAPPLYSLLYCKNVSIKVGKRVSKKVSKKVSILSKQETETKTYINPPTPLRGAERQKNDLDFSFVENDFKKAFDDWIEYKKAKKKKYANQKSIQACYEKLKELAGGNPEIAEKIVKQSMANGWEGLFELKNLPPQKQTGGELNRKEYILQNQLNVNDRWKNPRVFTRVEN
jgi:hypothetical protein